ncbi:ABC transporter ATP-binding protein [Nocardiopsis sp. JB363]|uniref:ABC transporter ATP-binding protein n=1 Tax=Nocardiopsis sp. JB363 TaxID=1434837 RepID=UPI000B35F09A|nr:ABC transporter ATP-binding protein [Nocardiopsis sp. JB363]
MTYIINMQGVGRTFPGSVPVHALKDVNFMVSSGEYVTVVGPSGSGKSTFLNLIGLLDTPSVGTYLIDGIDPSTMGEKQRSALRGTRIGFVFQSFHLIGHQSAIANTQLGMVYNGVPRKQRITRARDSLARVGLSHREEAVAQTLSGGERQRVAIARALAGRPSLLLCDEPTGNLDSNNANSILALLDELHADDITLIVVTHDSEVAARGQRIVTVKDGHLSEKSQ